MAKANPNPNPKYNTNPNHKPSPILGLRSWSLRAPVLPYTVRRQQSKGIAQHQPIEGI